MNEKESCTFGIRSTLQTLREQRAKICDDCLNFDTELYLALHCPSKAERRIQFEKYLVIWMDEHWNRFVKICDNHRDEFSEKKRKGFLLNFAKDYSAFILEMENSSDFSCLLIPDLLKTKKEALDEIIHIGEKATKNLKRLELENKKHKERYDQLLGEFKSNIREV